MSFDAKPGMKIKGAEKADPPAGKGKAVSGKKVAPKITSIDQVVDFRKKKYGV
jgi:hypothetical protein